MKGEKTMARKPMVTRTITTTKCNVLCLDIETAEPFNQVVTDFQTKCELLFGCDETQYPPETWETSTKYLEYDIRPLNDLIARLRSFLRYDL